MQKLFFIFGVLNALSLPAMAEDFQFKAGDRVIDSRNYESGTVVDFPGDGTAVVQLDGADGAKKYSKYRASELGPKLDRCDVRGLLCVGSHIQYFSKKGQIKEIFQYDEETLIRRHFKTVVYAIQFEGEKKITNLSDSHARWFKFLDDQPPALIDDAAVNEALESESDY